MLFLIKKSYFYLYSNIKSFYIDVICFTKRPVALDCF